MPYDYSDDVALAVEMITEFGAVMTFSRKDAAIDDADPLGPSLVADTTFELPGVGIEVIGSSFGRYVNIEELITKHDRVILTPGYAAQDIETFHFMTDAAGVTWKIGKVMSFEPGDTRVLHFVGLTR